MKSPWIRILCGALGAMYAGSLCASVESFEGASLPAGWKASEGGSLSITNERFKSGRQSLLWQWNKPGSSVTMAAPGGLAKMASSRGLAFWVYNEKPSDKLLYLEFLRNGSCIGGCWYLLNFKGWRPLGAPYKQLYISSEHLYTKPDYPAFEELRLTALPANGEIDAIRMTTERTDEQGRLYFDLVNFDCEDKLLSDDQQPWAGHPEILSSGNPRNYLYSSSDISRNRPWLPKQVPAKNISEAEKKSMEKLAGLALPPSTRCIKALSPKEDAGILEECRTLLNIRRNPETGILTGAPLVSAPLWNKIKFNSPPDGVVIRELFTRLAQAYLFERDKGNKEKAAELLRMYFDICDHILDQGFAEGSGNVSNFIIMPSAVIALREELAKTGRLRDMLNSVASCGMVISRNGTPLLIHDWTSQPLTEARNTDFFDGYFKIGDYHLLLALCVALPDPSERLQRLYAYRQMLSNLFDPSLGEPYAWDGTVHHHPMWHLAYGTGRSFDFIDLLNGTCFNAPDEVYEIVKRDFNLQAFAAGPGFNYPPNLPGYTGQPLTASMLKGSAARMVQYASPENKNGFDPDFAAVALWVLGPKKDPLALQIEAQGIRPARPTGHMTLNSASVALHRRGDWLVSIAGQNKFRRPYEGNPAYIAAAFNHNTRNGSIYVISSGNPPSPWDSGFSLEGWDSRLQPGATSYLGETEKQLYCRHGSSYSSFGGGTSLDGNGIWGMELIRRNVKIADNIRFHKSAFCFDNRITVITTDIGRGDTATAEERKLPFVTTLWQNAIGSGGETEITGKGAGRFGANPPKKPAPIAPAQEPCWIDGREIAAFPYQTTLSCTQPHWLIDNKRTGYYIPAGNPAVELTRRVQKWTFFGNPYFLKPGAPLKSKNIMDYQETEGNFSVAWFAHGAKPEVQECVYTLIPDATPEMMKNFSSAMSSEKTAPHIIRQKDARAHVLWDRGSNTTGYLIFDPGWTPFPGSSLLKVNRICAVMIRGNGNGLQVSAASTDMDEYPSFGGGPIRLSGNIELTLRGKWKIAGFGKEAPKDSRALVSGEDTVLVIPYHTFMPAELKLEKL